MTGTVIRAWPAAFAVTRILRTLLFEVTPSDPATYVAIVAMLAGSWSRDSCNSSRLPPRIEPTGIEKVVTSQTEALVLKAAVASRD